MSLAPDVCRCRHAEQDCTLGVPGEYFANGITRISTPQAEGPSALNLAVASPLLALASVFSLGPREGRSCFDAALLERMEKGAAAVLASAPNQTVEGYRIRSMLTPNDLAELRITLPICEDRLHSAAARVRTQAGRRKVGSIQNIEHLRAELYVESLRDTWNLVVLQHGEVNVEQSRPDD